MTSLRNLVGWLTPWVAKKNSTDCTTPKWIAKRMPGLLHQQSPTLLLPLSVRSISYSKQSQVLEIVASSSNGMILLQFVIPLSELKKLSEP
jgi:hypothetical protein